MLLGMGVFAFLYLGIICGAVNCVKTYRGHDLNIRIDKLRSDMSGAIRSTMFPGFTYDYDQTKVIKPVCTSTQSCQVTEDFGDSDEYDIFNLLNQINFCDCPSGTACDKRNPLRMGERTYAFCGQPVLPRCRSGQKAVTLSGLVHTVHCVCNHALVDPGEPAEAYGSKKDMHLYCKRLSVKKHDRPNTTVQERPYPF